MTNSVVKLEKLDVSSDFEAVSTRSGLGGIFFFGRLRRTTKYDIFRGKNTIFFIVCVFVSTSVIKFTSFS